ncbi:biopolymer transport protein ExbB/biopolymer transport protein TolQ [Parelusimicrobium proximum]|uniref:MotA/TolQ/ExbB proton channel family protein n=1 Tax=Parelusimicrobium proximum TaxID=3228953 RepID=UPI003D17CB20
MDFANMTNAKELLAAGGPVLIILLVLSVVSIAVMLERFFTFRKKMGVSRKLMAFTRYQLKAGDIQKISDACQRGIAKGTPAANLILKLLTSDKRGSELESVAVQVIDWEVLQLGRRLPVLATLGSTTPFIGLFGTVLGVMHAFADLATVSGAGAGPSVVAKGIAEALVNTAAGLFVAVPAVIAYNYFASQINFFEKELVNISQEIINAL